MEEAGACKLSEVPIGQVARIERLLLEGHERRRLLDLGLAPGTLIQPELVSPLGDPTAYRVRGASIALRRSQSDRIEVTPCSP